MVQVSEHIHDPDDHFDEALSGAYRALDKLRGEKCLLSEEVATP